MSLLTDSDYITAAMMAELDPEIPDIAATEGITISGDAGICRQSWDECADSLNEKMDSFGGYISTAAGAGAQLGTLMTGYGMGVSRSRIFLSQIVATDNYASRLSVLQRWMLYTAMVLFYRAASNRTVHDRYQQKHDQFESDAKKAWRRLWAKGIPIAVQPLPCPGALHEFNAGTWAGANVTAWPGASAPGSWAIAVTWVDQSRWVSPVNRGNAESGPSAPFAVTVPPGQQPMVSIASLVPPNGKAPGNGMYADGVLSPLKATGWNVYAGPAGGTLTLQNGTPLPLSAPQYSFVPSASGAILQPGQQPDANYAFANTLQRG